MLIDEDGVIGISGRGCVKETILKVISSKTLLSSMDESKRRQLSQAHKRQIMADNTEIILVFINGKFKKVVMRERNKENERRLKDDK